MMKFKSGDLVVINPALDASQQRPGIYAHWWKENTDKVFEVSVSGTNTVLLVGCGYHFLAEHFIPAPVEDV